MSFLKYFFVITVFAGVLCFTIVPVYAADDFHIVTCGTQKDANGMVTNPCTSCDLFSLGQRVYNFIFYYAAAPVATVMLMYAGCIMILAPLTGSSSGYKTGQKIIIQTLIGLAIVFFSWIAIDSILKAMVGQLGSGRPAELSGYGPWNEIKCEALESLVTIHPDQLSSNRFQPTLTIPDTILPSASNIPSSVTALRGLKCTGQMKWQGFYSGLDAAGIDSKLKDSGSPIAGSGDAIIRAATKYNIDPALAMAVWIKDSSLGTRGIATITKNPGNITAGDNESGCFVKDRRWLCYKTWSEGAVDWFRYTHLYLDPKYHGQYDTINGLISSYAPPSENGTSLYIDQVCERVAILSNDQNKILQACGCTK